MPVQIKDGEKDGLICDLGTPIAILVRTTHMPLDILVLKTDTTLHK